MAKLFCAAARRPLPPTWPLFYAPAVRRVSNFAVSAAPQSVAEESAEQKPKKKQDIFEFYAQLTRHVVPSLKLRYGYAGLADPKKRQVPPPSKKDPATIGPLLSVSYGEDALMARCDSLAVADGVGGWANEDADAALFSRLFLHNMAEELGRLEGLGEKAEDFQNVEPVTVMTTALKKSENVLGSCTSVLAILRGSQLRVASVGDAGLLVARKGTVVLRTKEQQHAFNFPYQLGKGCKTTPQDAARETLQVQLGDVLVVATDGLFDNLFDSQILEIIEQERKGKTVAEFHPVRVSEILVKTASDTAADTRSRSPFEAKATEEGLFFQGGKMDDISVVVAVIDNNPK